MDINAINKQHAASRVVQNRILQWDDKDKPLAKLDSVQIDLINEIEELNTKAKAVSWICGKLISGRIINYLLSLLGHHRIIWRSQHHIHQATCRRINAQIPHTLRPNRRWFPRQVWWCVQRVSSRVGESYETMRFTAERGEWTPSTCQLVCTPIWLTLSIFRSTIVSTPSTSSPRSMSLSTRKHRRSISPARISFKSKQSWTKSTKKSAFVSSTSPRRSTSFSDCRIRHFHRRVNNLPTSWARSMSAWTTWRSM